MKALERNIHDALNNLKKTVIITDFITTVLKSVIITYIYRTHVSKKLLRTRDRCLLVTDSRFRQDTILSFFSQICK